MSGFPRFPGVLGGRGSQVTRCTQIALRVRWAGSQRAFPERFGRAQSATGRFSFRPWPSRRVGGVLIGGVRVLREGSDTMYP
jgi:hypothetical protein